MKKAFRLDTREQRSRLPARHDPYYADVAKGVAVGYRKGATGASWYLRRFNGKRYHKREVGRADDTAPADGERVLSWPQVVRLAIAEPAKADAFNRRYSVQQCVDDYIQHRRATGRSLVSIRNDELTLKRFVDKFGSGQVADLTTSDLQRWRDSHVSQPEPDPEVSEAQRREKLRASQASANRQWTTYQAALNYAFNSGRVDADLAWRRIKSFQDVDQARTRFLSVAECNKLLGACPAPFRNLGEAMLLTGMRPGELSRLIVGQFKETRLEVSAGKGRLRHVPLTIDGQALFKRLTKGRPADALMLLNPEGKAWTRMQWIRAMRVAVKAAKLPENTVLYDLRRTYGSLLANAGAGDAIIASALGHSDTRMTRRHYAHLLDSVVAAELQAKLPKFKASRKPKVTP
jgi:integrase